jgi:Mg2+ and Co2+ transporter CorA
MNFDYMPELKRHYGYHTVMGPCFFIVIGMIIYFKKAVGFESKRIQSIDFELI